MVELGIGFDNLVQPEYLNMCSVANDSDRVVIVIGLS